jgi:hypothetical protein
MPSLSRKVLANLIVSFLLPTASMSQPRYDHHVVFDNSLTDRSYYFSHGSVVSPSTVEIIDGKFPIDDKIFFSPPNSLRLKWKLQFGGDWRMTLKVATRYGRRFAFSGNALFLRCFSESELSRDESPLIALQDANGVTTPDIKLLGALAKLPAQQWVQIKLPISAFVPIFKSTDLFFYKIYRSWDGQNYAPHRRDDRELPQRIDLEIVHVQSGDQADVGEGGV